jgi:tRNA pseudouridine55 synthase
MTSGWIILDKPLGLGSTQAVSAVKRNLREAGFNMKLKGGLKVGHGGTLDPLASGILPIALGEATKITGRMLDASKTYDFTIRFGIETDTLDSEGTEIATSDFRPLMADVIAALPLVTGDIDQVPPAFSALKVDGKRAYDLARAGEEVDLKSRGVTIYNISIRHPREGGDPSPAPIALGTTPEVDSRLRGNDELLDEITLTAHVSKGTYIRSLARDIAQALGTVGHVTYLRRTKAGPFDLSHAISLDKLNEIGKGAALQETLLPLEAGLADIPALPLNPDTAAMVRNGQVLNGIAAGNGLYLATLDAVPVALVEVDAQEMRVVRGFNL